MWLCRGSRSQMLKIRTPRLPLTAGFDQSSAPRSVEPFAQIGQRSLCAPSAPMGLFEITSAKVAVAMSHFGTLQKFRGSLPSVRLPAHNRPSGLNVGSPLHSRPRSEGCRRSVHDPTRTFGLFAVPAARCYDFVGRCPHSMRDFDSQSSVSQRLAKRVHQVFN